MQDTLWCLWPHTTNECSVNTDGGDQENEPDDWWYVRTVLGPPWTHCNSLSLHWLVHEAERNPVQHHWKWLVPERDLIVSGEHKDEKEELIKQVLAVTLADPIFLSVRGVESVKGHTIKITITFTPTVWLRLGKQPTHHSACFGHTLPLPIPLPHRRKIRDMNWWSSTLYTQERERERWATAVKQCLFVSFFLSDRVRFVFFFSHSSSYATITISQWEGQ